MTQIKNEGTARRRWGRRGFWCGVVGGALASLTGMADLALAKGEPPVPAAMAAPVAKMQFTNKQQFRLKIDLPEADRQKLKEVQLYVKGHDSNWACKETAAPSQTHFTFRAAADGEYWFTIVTVDKAGRAAPADVTKEPPAFVVVVDTQVPEVAVNGPVQVARVPGDETFRCSVKDPNVDPTSLKVEYQTADKSWKTLEAMPNAPDLFRCPDRASWTGQVKVTATDLAKNVTVREVGLTQPAAPIVQAALTQPAAPTPVAPPAAAMPMPVPPSQPLPLVPVTSAKITSPDVRGTEPAAPGGTVPLPAPAQYAAAPQAPVSNRLVLNQLHAALEYRIDQVGPSGVGKVEVWTTADEGKTWHKLCEDTDKRSPAEFDLPRDGTYGVAIVVANGNHLGDPPPANGTAPECWIEVDMTKPTGQLLALQPGANEDPWSMVISWAASDRNLGSEPIDLFYSINREGPWTPIVRGLKNDGRYIWTAPRDGGPTFYVRMEVTDRAGNLTRCDSPQPVVLDMSRPRAKVIGFSAPGTKVLPPSGN